MGVKYLLGFKRQNVSIELVSIVLGNWYTRAGDSIKRPEILRESTWRFESSLYYYGTEKISILVQRWYCMDILDKLLRRRFAIGGIKRKTQMATQKQTQERV